MKRYIILIISVIIFKLPVFSQSKIENVLAEIEQNNTTLSALRKNADAEKIGNKSGIYLQNPEVEFNYLWGSPSMIGNRTDLRVTQSFDFPSAYKYKNQISENKNAQTELEYLKQKKELFYEVRMICNQLIYKNAQILELTKRVEHAEQISKAYKTKLDAGESNILDYNKAELNLLNSGKELESIKVERSFLLAELARLNGGIEIEFDDSEFPLVQIPTNFEQWYQEAEQNNPVLAWLKQEIEISQNREKLNRAMSLPKLQTGYMSEKTTEEHFQGVTVGVSIPLWENKNTVKYAESQTMALQSIEADNQLQFYNRLKMLHKKATNLQNNASDYSEKLDYLNNSDLLKKALDKGQISLIEYMLELGIYYESINKMLDLQLDLQNSLTELYKYK